MQIPLLATRESLCYFSHLEIITAFCPSLLNPTCASFLQGQGLATLKVLPPTPDTKMGAMNIYLPLTITLETTGPFSFRRTLLLTNTDTKGQLWQEHKCRDCQGGREKR